MMGFNHQDLEAAMRGVAAPGEAIAQNRAEADRRQNLAIEQELRQRQLETEMRRLDVEQNREQLLGQGNINATLQDEEGNQITYSGPKTGYDGLMTQSGNKLTPVTVPKKSPFAVRMNLPDGTLDINADDYDDLIDKVTKLRKGGMTAPAKSFETGPTHNKQAWDAEQKKADDLEMEAGMTQDPIIKNYKLDQAKKVRSDADTFFKPKPAADPLVKLGEEPTDPNGANPGKRYIYGTRSQVTSGAPTAPAAPDPTSAQAAPPDPTQRRAGQKYRTPKGVFTWTGSGWKQ